MLQSEIDGLTSEREHERSSVEGEHAAELATLKEEQEAVRTPSLGHTSPLLLVSVVRKILYSEGTVSAVVLFVL